MEEQAKDKLFKTSLIIIGLLIAIGLFLNAYLLLKKEKPSLPRDSEGILRGTPTPLSVLPTSILTSSETVYTEDTRSANWKTYTNTKYGYEFKYPSVHMAMK